MQIHNLSGSIEFDDKKPVPKVLTNRPGYRLVLLNLRSGQTVPEHATREMVTVYAIRGHVTFYEDKSPYEIRTGEVLWIEGGVPHALKAHEDSTLLVVAAGSSRSQDNLELDLRAVPPPERHPLVFAQFDSLEMGDSFDLVNDHDPIPLKRQMDAMRPGQAEWSYLVRGPETFHIRIRRMAPLSDTTTASIQPGKLLNIQR